ncbi:MAG TPA: 5-(carboxyamino)imidazole ribonucleotide mutase [Actinomycetes bacterium]|jgi:phosphoribosylaminoimidazole carboxylase PurE protein|nr:5-(carboxyamino)imidazole ribonucleotide mutase [Actinomycetes bacterium]
MSQAQPRVGIVLGSSSDEEKAQTAAVMLEKFGVGYELEVLSAHRSPGRVADYAASAEERGLQVIIAAAGKAAALPGVIAANTVLPVIGLPIFTPQLGGQDSLYSIVQMPSGVPVATVGLDAAANAGILAVQILAISDPALRKQLQEFKRQLDEGLHL